MTEMLASKPDLLQEVADLIVCAIRDFTDEYLVVLTDRYQPATPRHYQAPVELWDFLAIFEDIDNFSEFIFNDILGRNGESGYTLSVGQEEAATLYGDTERTTDEQREAIYALVIKHDGMRNTLRWFAENTETVRRDLEEKQARIAKLMNGFGH